MKSYNFKKGYYVMIYLIVSSSQLVNSQNTLPVNSNLLIEYGISPKVLDAALSTTLQEGSFKEKVHLIRQEGGDSEEFDFIFIYDPKYKDGIDIRIAYEKDSLNQIKSKKTLKLMQQMHSFSRQSKSYLYDENSLEVISISEDEIILSFLYDSNRLEPELAYGKKLKGKIFIKNKELEKVELINTKRIKFRGHKVEAGDLQSTIFFKRSAINGGHIESSSIDKYKYRHKGENVYITITSETFEYMDENDQEVKWSEMPGKVSLENMEIIEKSLGWALPIYGKGARKLGYKLPRPIGVNVFMHFQSQVLELTDISVGLNDSDLIGVNSLVDLNTSTVPQNSQVQMLRADVWLFPFLNISGMIGRGKNRLDGRIYLSDELKQALDTFGFLIGISPEDVPDYFSLQSELNSLTYGGGITLAGGVGNFNLSLAYQLGFSEVFEANTSKVAHVLNASVGYLTPFGVNIMAGTQGQFYNTVTEGFLQLPNDNQLAFAVNFKPINWNFVFGIYAPVSDHIDISIQTGWGDRRSLTAIMGYRF